MLQEQEVWKDVPGYEGRYKISSFGNFKSLNYLRTKKERLLKPGMWIIEIYQSVVDEK